MCHLGSNDEKTGCAGQAKGFMNRSFCCLEIYLTGFKSKDKKARFQHKKINL